MGILKGLLKRAGTEGSCFDTIFAAYKNTRNETGFSPSQLFFLRNVRDPRLPDLGPEPKVGRMVEARDRVRAARAVAAEDKPGLAPLQVGDLVVGQHPKSMEWTMDGEVTAVTHGERAYIMTYHDGGQRMLTRNQLKLDKTGRCGYTAAEMRDLAKFIDLGEEEQGAGSATQQRAEAGGEGEQKGRGPRRSMCLIHSKRGVCFQVPVAEYSPH